MPRFLTEHRLGHVRLVEWLAILLGLPAFYLVTVIVNRLLTPPFGRLAQRQVPRPDGTLPIPIPAPARLLIVSLAGHGSSRGCRSRCLSGRRSAMPRAVFSLIALTWLVVLLVRVLERFLVRRFRRGVVRHPCRCCASGGAFSRS